MNASPDPQPLAAETMWAAVSQRDGAFDHRFLYGVVTTGVFCRPSCAARRPLRENTRFFADAAEALAKGFRPCRKCRPDLSGPGPARALVDEAKAVVAQAFDDPERLDALLDGLGAGRSRLARLFAQLEGASLAAAIESARLDKARRLLADTDMPVAAVALESGFPSLSSFYRSFSRRVGGAPSRYRKLQGTSP